MKEKLFGVGKQEMEKRKERNQGIFLGNWPTVSSSD